MCGVLAKDVELSIKIGLVKGIWIFGRRLVARAIECIEHDDGLENLRLARKSSGPENGVVFGDFAPSEDAQAQADCDLCKDLFVFFEFDLIMWVEENIADRILAYGREDYI